MLTSPAAVQWPTSGPRNSYGDGCTEWRKLSCGVCLEGNCKKNLKSGQVVKQLASFLDSYCRAGLSPLHLNVRNMLREYLLCALLHTLKKTWALWKTALPICGADYFLWVSRSYRKHWISWEPNVNSWKIPRSLGHLPPTLPNTGDAPR